MANSDSPQDGSKATVTDQASGAANHSLLKKSGPDDILLLAYRKVEKKLDKILKARLSDIIDRDVELAVGESEKLSFSDWLSGQDGGSVYLEFQFGSVDSPILVRMARLFLTASVDCFFGGQFDGETHSTGEPTKSEVAMVERLASGIADGLTVAWSTLFNTTVRYNRCFFVKDDIELQLDADDILVSPISVELCGHQIAAMDCIQTLDGLTAIEPQLNRPLHREVNEADPLWQANLKDSVEQVYMPVRSVLARPTMLLSELSQLAVGDILPVAATDNVPLIVGDKVFAHGSIGEQNGGVAFKINQFL